MKYFVRDKGRNTIWVLKLSNAHPTRGLYSLGFSEDMKEYILYKKKLRSVVDVYPTYHRT